MKIKVGAVIVSYNSGAELGACITSVYAQSSPEIEATPIIVDNDSSDNSVLIAKKTKAIVKANSSNLGFSKAVNLGIREAYRIDCTYILVLNPDAILKPGSLATMLKALSASDDNIAAVGPFMVHEDGSPANEGYYLKAPSLLTVSSFSTLLRPWALKRKFLVNRYEEQNLTAMRPVEQIPGACLLVGKKHLDSIGLLDEDFAIWFEDVEWSYRARRMGYKLLFCPDAHVIHEGGVSFSKWDGLEKSVTFYVSLKTFFRKHKPLSYPLIVCVLVLNAFVSYTKSRDKNHLRFIKRFVGQRKGELPN